MVCSVKDIYEVLQRQDCSDTELAEVLEKCVGKFTLSYSLYIWCLNVENKNVLYEGRQIFSISPKHVMQLALTSRAVKLETES